MNLKEQFYGLNLVLNLSFFALIVVALTLIAFDFKKYGDIFRFVLPALCVFMPFYERDFEKLKQLIFAILLSTLVIQGVKFGISYAVAHYDMGAFFSFAQRPIDMKRFDGFPSGHTQGAFIGFAFAFVYFKMRWKILFFCLALMVGISRIYSGYHTILQVICGAIISFLICYFVITFLQKRARL